ncbi:MAG: hypothetical protein V1708_01450 [Candidatus Micrarchaeota archaeon]
MQQSRLFAAAAVLMLSSLAAAECSFLEIGQVPNATARQGVDALYPISITNHGPGFQPVYISAASDTERLALSFEPASMANLGSGEQKTFTLEVGTQNAPAGKYQIPVEISTDNAGGVCTQTLSLWLNVTPAQATPTPEPLEMTDARIEPGGPRLLFPGETAQYAIFVSNRNGEEITVSMDSAANAFETSTRFSEKTFRMPAHSSKEIRATLTVPPGAPGGTFDIVLRATVSSACCEQEFLLPTPITVSAPTAALSFLNEPLDCIPAEQGSQTQFEVAVRNDGQANGPFSLSVRGDGTSTGDVMLDTDSLELNPGERTWMNVTIAPLKNTPTGLHYFTLAADYRGFMLYQRDYCFEVFGIKGFEVSKPAQIQAKRCATGSFEFTIRNAGTVVDSYGIDAKPLNGVNVYTDPAGGFSLSPGETQKVTAILGVSCKAPLGTQALPATIHSSESDRTETFNVEILPDEARQQYLKITAPSEVRAIQGSEKLFVVSVTNLLSANAEKTEVSVEGIPKEWLQIESPKTIKSGATASYRIRVAPSTPGDYEMTASARSGLEKSSAQILLSAEPVLREIDYSYTIEFVREGDEIRSAIMTLEITNNGNTDANNLALRTSSPDYDVTADTTIGVLSPGETRTITAQVRPLARTTQSTVPITLKSADGATATKPVSLPAMDPAIPAAAAFEFPWKIAAAIVLAILIFAILAKGEETYHV